MKKLILDDSGSLKPAVIWAVALVAVGAVGWFAYAAWARGERSNTVAMMCMTQGCDYRRERPLEVGEILPIACSKCQKRSVVPAFYCPQCRTPNIMNEDRGLKGPTKCTKCGKEIRHGG